jgi:hypothetical protein
VNDFHDAVGDLVARLEATPDGRAKVALQEEVIALADRHGEEELAFALRSESLMVYYAGRRPDLILVHFARCVAFAEANPDEHLLSILWQYRWVVDLMPTVLEIPRSQVEETWAEMRVRYKSARFSARPCWVLRRRLGIAMGDHKMAAEADAKFRKCRRDTIADDRETEAAFEVDYHAFLLNDDATLAAGEPFFNGTFTNEHFFVSVVHRVLRPLARRDEIARGRKLVKRAARIIARTPKLTGTDYNHLEFLATVGDFKAAVAEFDRHFVAGTSHPGRLYHYDFLHAGRFLCERLVKSDRGHQRLRTADGPVSAKDLLPQVTARLAALAGEADARHGNAYYTGRLAEFEQLHATADWLSLSGGFEK